MLYADYNATSPMAPEVQRAMEPYLGEDFGNPSSTMYPLGRRAREAIEHARASVAMLVGAKPEEVVFVSGGTESCHAALMGAFLSALPRRQIVSTTVEHPAVQQTLGFLSASPFDARCHCLDVDGQGRLDLAALEATLSPETGVVSVMAANNETGACFPLQEIGALVAKHGATLHVDGTQLVGKRRVDLRQLEVDLFSFSAHKIGGPKGVGALVVRNRARWTPSMRGGGQEGGARGGTEAVAQIVGFGKAAELVAGDLDSRNTTVVRDVFETRLENSLSGFSVNCVETDRLPNTSSVLVRGINAHELVKRLAEHGVMISAGSACSTGQLEPSHVLQALGLSTLDCLATLRVSFGPQAQESEARQLADTLVREVEILRAESEEELARRLTAA